MKLPYKLLHPLAKPPYFASDGAACFDLTCTTRGPVEGRTRVYGTGIALDIPEGYHVEMWVRSSLAFKRHMVLGNGTGIVDSDFSGEIKALLYHYGEGNADWPMFGDRIAQCRLVRDVKTELVETDVLKETKRGDGGFGSTGT